MWNISPIIKAIADYGHLILPLVTSFLPAVNAKEFTTHRKMYLAVV